MKIRMITIYAGPRGTFAAGEVTSTFTDEEARALIDAKHAEEVADAAPAEETAESAGAATSKKALTPAQENRLAHGQAKTRESASKRPPKAERAARP